MASKVQHKGPPSDGDRRTRRFQTAFMAFMVAAALICTAATSFALGIATDKLSYQTGEKVVITGKGWKAYETIALTINNTAGTRTPVKFTVTANSIGTFSNSTFVLQDVDRGQILTLKARGSSGTETLVAIRNGAAPGTLSCSSLSAQDGSHYGVPMGETVSCSIQGASDLSAAQQQGADPVEVLVKSSTLGNQPAKVISVSGNTIYFEYTAPVAASGSSIVSYGPITACDPQSAKCTTFATLGNDANSSIISGSSSAAGFAYAGTAAPKALVTTLGTTCYPSTCPAQLLVTKTPQNGSFTQGSQVSFQIQVKNSASAGSASATNVKLTDQLPGLGGLSWQSAYTTQGSCTNPISGNMLSCNLGTIAPQATVTVTVYSTATTPAAACVCQANPNATATADGGITAIGSGTMNCTPNPQLKVVKTPDNGIFAQGAQVSFKIVVSNPAPSAAGPAKGVVLTDTLPGNGGLVWSSATTTQGSCISPIVGNALNCNLGDIPPQGSVTVTVTSVSPTPAAACQSQPNPAAIATAYGGLTAQDSGSLICYPPQLKVVKNPDGGSFTAGGQASFTIYVSNPSRGTTPATNVKLTDVLPTAGGMSWTSVTWSPSSAASCSITNNVLNCSIPSIPPQATLTVNVFSPTTTPVSACQYQNNPAAIATADGGLMAQDSGSLNCRPVPQLKVVKTPDNGTFNMGGPVRFTIVVSNPAPAGSASATNVKLNDLLPGNGGLAWSSASTTQGSCVSPIVGNALNCSLGTIAPGASVTVTVSSPSSPVAACQLQNNAAAIATADGGLTAQDSGSLNCVPPQLRVVKTPDNGTFTSGGPVSFTIVVSNPASAGASPATNVQLTDLLPGNGGLVWSSAVTTQGTCVNPIVGNALSCSLRTINPGSSVTVTVSSPSTPTAACQSQPNPVALATADGGLTAQDSGSLNCVRPQLSIVKTPDNGVFHAGEQASFNIVVGNPGTVPATNVQLTDQLPGNGGLTWNAFTTSQGSCTLVSNLLRCSLGTINPGANVNVTVTTTATRVPACQSQPNPAAVATADGGVRVQDSGSLSCVPPQLSVVKTPDNGTFQNGGMVTFQIVVSNPAPANASAATNVTLTDVLPILGGLTWTSTTTTQGTCGITGNTLNCTLGTLQPGQSVTVTVSSPATTPAAACQLQNNPAAIANADGGLTARDSGSVNCTPCIIPGVIISNTSWNAFPIPAGTSPFVWVHAHIGTPSGIPTTTVSTVRFTGVTISLNGTVYRLPDGLMTFNPAAPSAPTTRFNAALNQWETLVNPSFLSNEMFFTGAAIPVTPQIAAGAKATLSFTVQSSAPKLSFPWQWSAAVYKFWPSDWNVANILAYHATLHAGTPLNTTVQQSLIQGPRGGGGSNFTGSWSATGNGTCP